MFSHMSRTCLLEDIQAFVGQVIVWNSKGYLVQDEVRQVTFWKHSGLGPGASSR